MDPLGLINLKLKGVSASAKRARLAFFILILAACAVTVTLYNEHFAWSRRLLEDNRGFTQWPPPPRAGAATTTDAGPSGTSGAPPSRDSARELIKEKHLEIVKNAEDRTDVRLDLLGISLGSGDLTFFGSIGMLVVSIYYCLCARRICHDIKSLVADVSQWRDNQMRLYVLAGIRQSLVLTVAAENDGESSDSGPTSSPKLLRLVTHVLSFLAYAPAIAIAAIIAGDFGFACLRDDVPNWRWVLPHLQGEYFIQFVILDLLALGLLVFVWQLNRLSNRFEQSAGRAVCSLSTPYAPPADRTLGVGAD